METITFRSPGYTIQKKLINKNAKGLVLSHTGWQVSDKIESASLAIIWTGPCQSERRLFADWGDLGGATQGGVCRPTTRTVMHVLFQLWGPTWRSADPATSPSKGRKLSQPRDRLRRKRSSPLWLDLKDPAISMTWFDGPSRAISQSPCSKREHSRKSQPKVLWRKGKERDRYLGGKNEHEDR